MKYKSIGILMTIATMSSLIGCSVQKVSVEYEDNAIESKEVFNNNLEYAEKELVELEEKKNIEKAKQEELERLQAITKNVEMEIKDSLNDNTSEVSSGGLDNKKYGWGLKRGVNGALPDAGPGRSELLSKYQGYYLGNINEKVIYLTFDNGYENGNTHMILDILKKNNVKAAFFVTTPYIDENPDIIKRMFDEGHVVGNHSTTHPSMPSLNSIDAFRKELDGCSNAYKNITNTDMESFFRPPMGEFSVQSLSYTKELGYKSIFWSFAYKDWDVKNQPNPSEAKETIYKNIHNGEIMLLHSVSKTNTEILDEVIKTITSRGYEFKTLRDLP